MVRYALSVLAGAALPLAFAPFGHFWVAPLAFAVLLYVWRDATPPRAFGLGFAFGCASFGVGTYWTFIAVRIIGGAPVAVALFLTIGLVIVLALFIGGAGYVGARWFKTRGAAAWLLVLPALFVLGEWLRGWVFTGFGWLAAGYSQTDSWLMGFAPITGIYGMSWAVLLTAGVLVTIVAGSPVERQRALLVLAAVWALGYAAGSHRWSEPKGNLVTVALVQGDVTQDQKWKPEQLPDMLTLYQGLTNEVLGTQLIVWPEAAIPTLVKYVRGWLESVQAAALRRGSTVLLGILREPERSEGRAAAAEDDEPFQNVVVSLTAPQQIYVKRHLVPFGEYFPVPSFIRSWMRMMNLPSSDALPGKPDQPTIDVAGERIAVTICYEDVFGAEQLRYLPEATLLVNVSNDAWFGHSIAAPQHLQIARVRAAEAGRYLLRSTNTGITAVIDPEGNVVKRAPQFKAAVLKYAVQGFTGETPYALWGNWLVVVAALVVLATQLPAITKFTMRPRT